MKVLRENCLGAEGEEEGLPTHLGEAEEEGEEEEAWCSNGHQGDKTFVVGIKTSVATIEIIDMRASIGGNEVDHLASTAVWRWYLEE